MCKNDMALVKGHLRSAENERDCKNNAYRSEKLVNYQNLKLVCGVKIKIFSFITYVGRNLY